MVSYPIAPKKAGAMSLMGLSLHPVDVPDIHAYIDEVMRLKAQALILNLNIHCAILALRNSWLRNFINEAQLVFCDGDGVRWGAKLLGCPVPPKVAFTRWIWKLAEFAEKRGYRFYFLGAKPGVADEAARRLKEKYPNLKIAGVHHGYFDKRGAENEKVVSEINRLKPDLLVVCFGMPFQEKWIMENWRRMEAHVFLPAGAVFDYMAGHLGTTPEWMIRWHLEWFFRFLEEPRRLFARYFFGIPIFFFFVFLEKIRNLRRKGFKKNL